jgi:PBP1b-binding outer membrane lipoprotein LpoB|tara:strand:+ start:55 stop:387 length:333 start_codon:yes stop_codon:yes gene_type:complete
MKKYKFYIILLSLVMILSSCQKFSEGMTGTKRSKSSDEFLVHKKKPLVVPPDFDDMPSPKQKKISEEKSSVYEESIEDLLNIKKEENNENFENNNDKSLEQSILKKIQKN